MKYFHLLYCLLIFVFLSCGPQETSNGENGPGPVSETDRQRFNLNPADELHYETLQDSIMQDSMMQETP